MDNITAEFKNILKEVIQTASQKEIIGIWIGENETSKYWLTVLNDIKKEVLKMCLHLQ